MKILYLTLGLSFFHSGGKSQTGLPSHKKQGTVKTIPKYALRKSTYKMAYLFHTIAANKIKILFVGGTLPVPTTFKNAQNR